MIVDKVTKIQSSFIEDIIQNPSITYNWNDDLIGNNTYTPGGVCNLFNLEKNYSHPLTKELFPIFEEIIQKHNFNFFEIVRIRHFIQPNIKVSKKYKHDVFHKDLNIDNYSLVYYINNSGGGTVIDTPEILYEVKHIKGNYVIFDGHNLNHAGKISGNNTTRSVINVNFLIKN